jgi:hypothetical protein
MFPNAKRLNEIASNAVNERTKILIQQNTQDINSLLTKAAENGHYSATVYFENYPIKKNTVVNSVTISCVPDGEQKAVANFFAEELQKAGYTTTVRDTRDDQDHMHYDYVILKIMF